MARLCPRPAVGMIVRMIAVWMAVAVRMVMGMVGQAPLPTFEFIRVPSIG